MVIIAEVREWVTDLDGRRTIDSRIFLATNGILRDEFPERLQRSGRDD
jgi:hypothetical protein